MSRNLLVGIVVAATVGATLVVLGTASRATAPPGPPAAVEPPLAELGLALLAQRESDVGAWHRLPVGPRCPRLRRGDELQITARVGGAGYLLVAMASDDGRFQLLYPRAGQTGAVRSDFAYALPGPRTTYRMDGRPTTLLVLVSREALPTAEAERIAMLRAVRRRAGPSPHPSIGAVALELRDGAPVEVPLRRYAGPAPLLVAVEL